MTVQEQIRQAKLELKALEAKVPQQPTVRVGKLTAKVTEKGGISIYGTAKFPVTLYLSQLSKITELAKSPEFMQFLQDNMAKLAVKEEKKAE